MNKSELRGLRGYISIKASDMIVSKANRSFGYFLVIYVSLITPLIDVYVYYHAHNNCL